MKYLELNVINTKLSVLPLRNNTVFLIFNVYFNSTEF